MSKDFTGISGPSAEKGQISAQEQLGNGDRRTKTRKMEISLKYSDQKNTHIVFS